MTYQPDSQFTALTTGPQQLQMYELRRYDPTHEYANGRFHKNSRDLVFLKNECGENNTRSSVEDGFKQWWIVDAQGEIIYPLEIKSSVYTSPAAELSEVLQPFREMGGFKSAAVLHDFLFLTKDVDELANAERLRLLAREMELAAEHIRKLLELQRQG